MSRKDSPLQTTSGALTLTLSRKRERGPEAPPSFAAHRERTGNSGSRRTGDRTGSGVAGCLAVVLSGAALLLAGGCAKVSTAGGGTGSSSGSGGIRGTGTGGVAGPGTGGFIGRGDDGGLVTSDGGGTVCQEGKYMSVPQIPTVYVMVDRSGSMFDCMSTPTNVEASCPDHADTSWTRLKDAVVSVVGSLETQIRFGFATVMGTNPMFGGTCPIIDKVSPALSNAAAITTLYEGLPFPPNSTQSGVKFETPARQVLDLIGAELLADPAAGQKYILLVTDGQPDYCDDSNSLCAPDSVIGGLQALKAKGITTVVMGLQSALNDLPMGVLQSFANAGAGEPAIAPLKQNLDSFAFFDQCNPVAGWHADLLKSGKTEVRGTTLGTYSTTAGPTKPYAPDVANRTMLVNQLGQALSGVKSCMFDLNNLNGKKLTVDLTMLEKVGVKVQDMPVALDMTNGWRMNSASELELVGNACTNWRMPQSMNIDIQIPCAAIIIQ